MPAATDDDITAGPLRPRVRAATERALAAGTLGPIGTQEERVDDDGCAFRLRIVASLARKEAAQQQAAETGFDRDPFLPPYEEGLYVGRVPPAHVGLLNKFPVLDDHLLIVTAEAEPQEDALTVADCEALLRALAGGGLAFYNAGEAAGASQPHRHLQWVPLDGPPPLADAIGRGTAWPFPLASEPMPAAWLADPAGGASGLHACYARLLAAIARAQGDGDLPLRPHPYNLLATRERVWAVPREYGTVEGVAINALGYAGFMLAANDAQAETIRTRGPLALLAAAARR